MKRAWACALLQLAAITTMPVVRAADPWYESYAAALKAISSRNWANAERKLKAAIRDGPAPGRGVRTYGVRFVDFQPGFYLGMAYFNQQRYAEALAELKRVQAANLIVKGDAEYQQMVDMIELASIRVAGKPSDAQKEAETLIRFARDLIGQDSLDEARRAYESAKEKDPNNVGLSGLGDAIAKKEVERKAKTEEDTRKREVARKADLDSVLETGRQLLAAKRYREVRDAIGRGRSAGLNDPRLDDLMTSADFGEGIMELSGLVLRGEWNAARQKATALAARNATDPELQRLRGLIENQPLPEALPRPLAGGHELEGTALRAFYSGRYQTAAEILSELAAGKGRSARVLFYLACSNSALGLLSGKDGEALLRKARQQWADAKRLDPTFAPDDRLISPRIIAVLQSR